MNGPAPRGRGAGPRDRTKPGPDYFGIVGAGGIGGTMFAAFQRFDYDFLFTILLAIIAMIMVSEVLQNWIKKLFQ